MRERDPLEARGPLAGRSRSTQELILFFPQTFAYPLQRDASQYGASTQQQGQHAHQGHGDVERHTRVVVSWRF